MEYGYKSRLFQSMRDSYFSALLYYMYILYNSRRQRAKSRLLVKYTSFIWTLTETPV